MCAPIRMSDASRSTWQKGERYLDLENLGRYLDARSAGDAWTRVVCARGMFSAIAASLRCEIIYEYRLQ